MTSHERYDVVGKVLPPELPAVTREQALRVCAAIERHFGFTVPWGWRHTGPKDRVWISNRPTAAGDANKGLGRIIHDTSHGWFRRVYGKSRKAHDPLHVSYEQAVAEFVATLIPKWFTPKPAKPKPTRREKRVYRLSLVDAGLVRWDAKKRRAERAIRKLKRERSRLIRAIQADTGLTVDG